MDIPMSDPDSSWPSQFKKIASELACDLMTGDIAYISIIHVGSTSIAGLNAKPIIDILITLDAASFTDNELARVRNALRSGQCQPGYHYIGNGGLKERWSFKLNIREDKDGNPLKPLRNVYVVPHNALHHRSYIALRDTLRDPANADLKDEYGKLKWDLVSKGEYTDIWIYAEAKNAMVRKILERAGWTDTEIAEKENMREKNWPDELLI